MSSTSSQSSNQSFLNRFMVTRWLVWRIHFFIGIFVAPCIIVTAITGAIYSLTPLITHWKYHSMLYVSPPDHGGEVPTFSYQAQWDAYHRAHPGERLTGFRYYHDPHRATQLQTRNMQGQTWQIFINPYTNQVIGQIASSPDLPIMTRTKDFHRTLFLGNVGRLYNELSASWLFLSAISGITIYMYRRTMRKHHNRDHLSNHEKRKKSPRSLLISRHATTGGVAAGFIAVLTLSGVLLSHWSGHRLHQWASGHGVFAPKLTQHPVTITQPVDAIRIDKLIAQLPAAGITSDFQATLPDNKPRSIVVRELAQPYRLTRNWAEIHPQTLAVLHTISYQHDYSVTAKIIEAINRYHAGSLAGTVNQIFLCILSLTVMFLILSGYRIWWLRRTHHYVHTPTLFHLKDLVRVLKKPTPTEQKQLVRLSIIILITGAIIIVLPMIGITLAVCIVGETGLWIARWGMRTWRKLYQH